MPAIPKYKKQFAEDLPEMFSDGKSVIEVCTLLGVSRQAYYDWVKKYPRFKQAHLMGKDLSEAWWCKIGRAATVGKVAGFQGSAWVFTMKNRFGWRDQPEIEREVTGPVVINFVDATHDNNPIN
jgi:transposase